MSDIYFMPLGGAQNVGASCYFLKIGNSNILLDAGIGRKNGLTFYPNMYGLLTSPWVQSLAQIDQVFISHAHGDHVGYLFDLLPEMPRTNVYMTEATRLLTQLQLYERRYFGTHIGNREEVLNARNCLDQITSVSYLKKMPLRDYTVTFYPAGHIPGAMMMLFEIGNRKILYTGDYSLEDTLLTSKCIIPEEEIDTVIMCGLHAKHPWYKKKEDGLYEQVSSLFSMVKHQRKSVICHCPQLSKGAEFLKLLNQYNKDHIPVYIDENILEVVQKMEYLSVPILNEHNYILRDWDEAVKKPHIYLTSNAKSRKSEYEERIQVDFSLHEDFEQMISFIKKINPRHTLLLHCAKEHHVNDETIEQRLAFDPECRTQITFAEEGQLYKL